MEMRRAPRQPALAQALDQTSEVAAWAFGAKVGKSAFDLQKAGPVVDGHGIQCRRSSKILCREDDIEEPQALKYGDKVRMHPMISGKLLD